MMFSGGDIPVFAASFAVVAALLFWRRYQQKGAKDDGKRYPPSLSVLPVFGAMIRGGMSVLPQYFMKSAEKLGPVYSCRMGKRLVVVVNGYDAIYDALVKHSEAFANIIPLYTEEKIMNPELRGIAYTNYDEAYKKYHKLSLSILREFGFGVQSVTETRILQEVETMKDEILKQNGRPFDSKWLMVFSTSCVTLSIVFGKNIQQSSPEIYSKIVRSSVECVSNFDLTLSLAPILRFVPLFWKTIRDFGRAGQSLLSSIEQCIEFIKSDNSEPTFIGRFLEIEGTDYIHKDLLYIVRDFCFGSTDTMSTTMQWAIVELANHPDIQKRFQKEIDEMVPGDRLPSLDDKPRLPYAEAVILEIMRRRTIVPLYIPRSTLKDTKVLGYDVPKGCTVVTNAYGAHMDRQFWKDPENFRPERFLDADNKIINAHRVIPFALGKRSCIGEIMARQAVFLFIVSLVQRFDIRPPEGQKTINVKERIVAAMEPTHFKVRLIPRVKLTQG